MISTKLWHTMPWYLKCKFSHCLFILDPYLNFNFQTRCRAASSSFPDRGITANFTFHLFHLITWLICSLMDSSFFSPHPKKQRTKHFLINDSLVFRLSVPSCVLALRLPLRTGWGGPGARPSVAPDLWRCHRGPAVIYQHLNFPPVFNQTRVGEQPLTLKLN